VPLVPAVVAPAGQAVVAAASSKSEIAIVHDSYGGGFNSNNYVTVASFDGLSARHVPIGPAFATAIASDGEQFYMLRNLWFGPLTFEILGTSTKVELASRGWAVRLLWTGEEFLAIWSDVDGKEFLARLDRTGKVLSLPRPLDSSQILSFVEKDGRVLLGSYKSPGIEVAVLDAHGNPIGAPEQMTLLNPYGGFALATTGDTDAFAGVSSNFDDLVLGVRPRNGVFVRSATTPEPPPPSRMLNDDGVAIAAIDDRFVVAFTVHAPVLPATHIALLEKQGLATGAVVMPAGTAGRTLLVEIAPGRLVLVYARVLDEPRYAGLTRVFMRAVSFTGESASATERAASRRQ
jgi:hypothetical protein